MSSKSSHKRPKSLATQVVSSKADRKFLEGLGWHQRGQLPSAAECYRQALQADATHAEALHHLGIVAYQTGNLEPAVDLIGQAIEFNPTNAAAYNNRGLALQDMRQYERARDSFEKAISLDPDYVDALTNWGNVLQDLGQVGAAIASYDRVIALKPDYAQAFKNRGDAQRVLGQREAAVASYSQALALQPRYTDALINRGNTLRELRHLPAALADYEHAIGISPELAVAHNNRANMLQEFKQRLAALDGYDRAIALDPDYAPAHHNRGIVLRELGRPDQAITSFRRAIELNPGDAEPRWAIATARIPAIFQTTAQTAPVHENFLAEVVALDQWLEQTDFENSWADVGNHQPFYLAYQEQDNSGPLSRYGQLSAKVMARWQHQSSHNTAQQYLAVQTPDASPDISSNSAPASACGRIVIGIISNHIHEHSVWNALIKGLMLHLDPLKFELCVFYLGASEDDQTKLARSLASVFIQDKWSLSEWVQAINDQHPDVLLYPEIGMDPMTTKLASLRLAPLQLASWGHPQTTGLPTIDYYLSAADFEPSDATSHYTEKLVSLPGLGCAYQRLGTTPGEVETCALGIKAEVPLLLCPGVPFKYAPQFDQVFVDIARRLGQCQFVFFVSPDTETLSDLLKERLNAVFRDGGLDFSDYAVFTSWMDRNQFYGLMEQADVYLDTIGFSGFNSAMQAIECGLPIVTREGRFMRGRLASGLLKRIGLAELVAPTQEEYVNLVVQLAQNRNLNLAIRKHMAVARDVLFDDVAPIRTLEQFLIGQCRPQPADLREKRVSQANNGMSHP